MGAGWHLYMRINRYKAARDRTPLDCFAQNRDVERAAVKAFGPDKPSSPENLVHRVYASTIISKPP
jgi:hypothetical protein